MGCSMQSAALAGEQLRLDWAARRRPMTSAHVNAEDFPIKLALTFDIKLSGGERE